MLAGIVELIGHGVFDSICTRQAVPRAGQTDQRSPRGQMLLPKEKHVLALVFSLSSFLILNPQNPKVLQQNPRV